MGQKVNPVGLRVGVIRDWESKWYADKDYADLLHEDIKIREYIENRLSNITKPAEGHAAKADTTPKRFMKEIRDVNLADYTVGQEVKVDTFAVGEKIDVTGISKGKMLQRISANVLVVSYKCTRTLVKRFQLYTMRFH